MRRPVPPLHQRDFGSLSNEGVKWLELVRNNSIDIKSTTFTFNPASIAANTTVEQTTSVSNLKIDDLILRVIKPTHTAGISVNDGRVTASNTLGITFTNATVGAIDPPQEIYTVIYIKNSRT